jgi:signal peptidase I
MADAPYSSRFRWSALGVVLLLTSAALARTVVEPRTVISGSMAPTFGVGDHVVIDKLTYRLRPPRPGEIVLFVREGGRTPMVKRVMAVAGQEVEVAGGQVRVDGVLLEEDYLAEAPTYTWGPTQVPSSSLFVLGDNRNASADSHVWGFVPRDAVIGRVALRFWRGPQQSQ